MDVFGSVCLAIDLVNKIKGTFGQVGQNSHDCVILSADILKSLLKVKEFWEQNSLYPPEELQESQSEFDRELKAINASLESLIKPAKGGGSIPDLTVLYNADEIQDELDRLLRNVQRCEQELQTWNTLRSESSGSILHPNAIGLIQDQDASMTHLQNELRALVPGLNPERRATLEQIEQVLLDHFRDRNASGYVQQEHDNFQTRNRSQATPLIKSVRDA
ncbi:hypothetical protein FRC02_011795 [Tulasnella sp. 418]|nr:hypothetical protein FRC02_011795 [Tulasnella sp. 418]